MLSGSDGPYEHLDLQFAHSRSGTFDNPIVRKAFLKTVPRQKILDELIVPLQEEARLRSSQVFLPGEQGYATSVRKNDSSGYRTVDIEGAKALLVQAGVVNPQVCILFDPSNPRRVAEFRTITDSAALAGFSVTDCSSTDWRQLLGTDGAYDASLYALRPSSRAVSAVSAAFRSDSPVGNDTSMGTPEWMPSSIRSTPPSTAASSSASCRRSTRCSGRMGTGCRPTSSRRSLPSTIMCLQRSCDGSVPVTAVAEPAVECLGLVAGW